MYCFWCNKRLCRIWWMLASLDTSCVIYEEDPNRVRFVKNVCFFLAIVANHTIYEISEPQLLFVFGVNVVLVDKSCCALT